MKKRKYLIIILIFCSLPLLFFGFKFSKYVYYFYDDYLDVHGFVKQIYVLENGDRKIEIEYLNPVGEGICTNIVHLSTNTDIFCFGSNEKTDLSTITKYDYVCIKYGTTALPFGIYDDTDKIIYAKVSPQDTDTLAEYR